MAYATSELYKEAIKKASRTTKITGTLTTKSGVVIDINNDVIDAGSLYITNQCVSSDAFQYGSVFSAEAGLTLKTDIDRYSLFDAELSLVFNILLSNNEYESIPLGKFYINEPNRIGKNISIKAYDNMLSLDVDIEESTDGTPYDLLVLISERCKVELAQTQEEIEALTNGTKLFSLSMDRVETYRELLSYIGVATCTYAAFDREGKLRLYEFATESSLTIEPKIRTSSKFSDFESYYTSMKAYFLESGVSTGYVTKAEVDDGLLYDADEVPIVQGLHETNQEIINSMFSKLQTIRYTPCEISFNGDPSVDLGDMVTCIDREGNEIPVLVTFYKWSYRGSHQLKSAGINPKLASVKEKKNKDLTGIEAEINAKTVAVYTYTNTRDITVKGGNDSKDMKEVVRISFTVDNNTTALVMTTVYFTMDCDGFIQFDSYLDGLFYENSSVCQYCQKGDNVVTFINYIACKKNTTYRFSVMAKTYYKETELRVNAAKIATNENARVATIIAYESIVSALKNASSVPITSLDSTIEYDVVKPIATVPKASIPKFHAKAAIFGQGLAGEADWDGTIEITESVSSFTIDNSIEVGLVPFASLLGVEKQKPEAKLISQSISKITLLEMPQVSLSGFNYELNTLLEEGGK